MASNNINAPFEFRLTLGLQHWSHGHGYLLCPLFIYSCLDILEAYLHV
jgi:hypothetical protein